MGDMLKHISVNLKNLEIRNFDNFGKDGHRKRMKIRLKILGILNMGSISPRKHEMEVL